VEIESILKQQREVNVSLSADDLVIICNALYSQLGEKKDNENFLQLYSDMMIATVLMQSITTSGIHTHPIFITRHLRCKKASALAQP
jgi:hypothetical protein